MRRLKGGLPRALKSHGGREGALYGSYLRALLDRVGELPASALPTLKQCGLVQVELDRHERELETALSRRRMRDARRLRRHMVVLRTQALTLERRIEELAASVPRSWEDLARRQARTHG